MHPMFLPEVEYFPATGSRGEMMARLRAAGIPIPQIQHLFAFKPDRTDHLGHFTHGVMRGPVAFAPPTATDLSRAEEGRRLKRLQLKAPLSGREFTRRLIACQFGSVR